MEHSLNIGGFPNKYITGNILEVHILHSSRVDTYAMKYLYNSKSYIAVFIQNLHIHHRQHWDNIRLS